MSQQILQVTGLTARIEEKELLHGVDLTIRKGETHVLMGPNGAGKSTLGYVLMGSPKYTVTDGSIVFEGQDITEESADKRARAGMFLSFQEPLEVPGLTLESWMMLRLCIIRLSAPDCRTSRSVLWKRRTLCLTVGKIWPTRTS